MTTHTSSRLLSEAVIASYIHDISQRHSSGFHPWVDERGEIDPAINPRADVPTGRGDDDAAIRTDAEVDTSTSSVYLIA